MKIIIGVLLVVLVGCGSSDDVSGSGIQKNEYKDPNLIYPEDIPEEVRHWFESMQSKGRFADVLNQLSVSAGPPALKRIDPTPEAVRVGWRRCKCTGLILPPGWGFRDRGVPYYEFEGPKDQPMVEELVRTDHDMYHRNRELKHAIEMDLLEKHNLEKLPEAERPNQPRPKTVEEEANNKDAR